MNRNLVHLLVLVVGTSLTGCASSRAYLLDRGRDLTDIVTVGAGCGGGAKVRIGPLQTGLLVDKQFVALRGSQFPCRYESWGLANCEVALLAIGYESFHPGCEADRPACLPRNTAIPEFGTANRRHKTFEFDSLEHKPMMPFVMLPDDCPSYYTQIEVVGGLLLNLRLGVNPGEVLDFILGWGRVDIFNDDLHARFRRESNQVPEDNRAAPEK